MDEFQALYTTSHALVIGIDTYGDPRFVPLGAAENDAQAVASTLAAPPYQFHVTTLLGKQATRAAILEELFTLRDTDSNDRVLVYFAGHGYTLSNRFGAETGYLAAADTVPEQDFTAIPLTEVTNLRLYAGAKHIGFIFDACFSGQVLGLTRSAAVAADKFLLRRAYQVISAGAGDQTVADFHSMTDVLIAALGGAIGGDAQPLTFSRLGLHLQETMAADSNHMQIPQFGHLQGSQGGEFVLEAEDRAMISEGLGAALVSNSRHIRLGAVDALIELTTSGDADQAQYARQWLTRIAAEDQDPQVREAAARFLGSGGEPVPLPEAPAAPPIKAPPVVRDESPLREVDVLVGWARLRAMALRHSAILIMTVGWVLAWLASHVTFTILNQNGVDDPFILMNLLLGAAGGLVLALAIRRIAPQRIWHIILMIISWGLVMRFGDHFGRTLGDVIYEPLSTFLTNSMGDTVASFVRSYINNVAGLPVTGLLGGLATGILLTIYYRAMRWPQIATLLLPWIAAFILGGWLDVIIYESTSEIPGVILQSVVAGSLIGLIGGRATLRQVGKAISE